MINKEIQHLNIETKGLPYSSYGRKTIQLIKYKVIALSDFDEEFIPTLTEQKSYIDEIIRKVITGKIPYTTLTELQKDEIKAFKSQIPQLQKEIKEEWSNKQASWLLTYILINIVVFLGSYFMSKYLFQFFSMANYKILYDTEQLSDEYTFLRSREVDDLYHKLEDMGYDINNPEAIPPGIKVATLMKVQNENIISAMNDFMNEQLGTVKIIFDGDGGKDTSKTHHEVKQYYELIYGYFYDRFYNEEPSKPIQVTHNSGEVITYNFIPRTFTYIGLSLQEQTLLQFCKTFVFITGLTLMLNTRAFMMAIGAISLTIFLFGKRTLDQQHKQLINANEKITRMARFLKKKEPIKIITPKPKNYSGSGGAIAKGTSSNSQKFSNASKSQQRKRGKKNKGNERANQSSRNRNTQVDIPKLIRDNLEMIVKAFKSEPGADSEIRECFIHQGVLFYVSFKKQAIENEDPALKKAIIACLANGFVTHAHNEQGLKKQPQIPSIYPVYSVKILGTHGNNREYFVRKSPIRKTVLLSIDGKKTEIEGVVLHGKHSRQWANHIH